MPSRISIVVPVSLFLMVGCSGTMRGMIRQSGVPVTIAYQQNFKHDDLYVTLPSGETFKGKVVMVGKRTGYGYGFGTGSATSAYGGYASGQASAFSVVESYTGNMQGVLFGDRGHTMRCQFQYADSSGETSSGGVGVCETSDGGVIDVQW